MKVLDNDKLSFGIFLVALWSSVMRLGLCQNMTDFSKVSADLGSLQVLGDPQNIRSAIDCARVCTQGRRGREEEPKCEGWSFDSPQSTCELYSRSIYKTSNSNGDAAYRFKFGLGTESIQGHNLWLRAPIQRRLVPGMIISISGSFPANPTRMEVKYKKGHDRYTDYIVYMDVRFDYNGYQDSILWNTKINGAWGSRDLRNGVSPLSPETPFTMSFKFGPDSVRVDVDNEYWSEFTYLTLPFNLVDTLDIVGRVTITKVRFQ